MKSAEDAEKLMKRYCRAARHGVGTSHRMDNSVLNDALAAYDKSTEKPAAAQPNLWRITMKSTVARLTVAAAIIVAVLLGVSLFWGTDRQPDYEIARSHAESDVKPTVQKPAFEQKDIDVMLAGGNVDGLVTMVSQADFKAQVGAANYLARLDRVEALEVLEKLNAGHTGDDSPNPFALATEAARSRIEVRSSQRSVEGVAKRKDRSGRRLGPGLAATSGDVKVSDSSVTQTSEALEGDVVEADESNLATSAAGPTLVEGISGYAYYFDGAGDHIDIGDDPSIQTEVLTILAWISTDDTGRGFQSIVSFEQGSHAFSVVGDHIGYGWQWKGGGGRARSTIQVGQWVFVAVTRDADYKGSIYVDGELDGLFIDDTTSSFARRAKIGGDAIDGEYFRGVIDEVAIFNTALSAEQIWWHYEHPGALTGGEAGLVGYWDFDNDDGEIVMDRSPYGNHGKLGHLSGRERGEHKSVEAPSDGEALPEPAQGASGYGYYFDGDGDYIEIGPIDGLGPEQTKMLWVYADPFEQQCNIYLLDEGGNNNWIELCGSDGNSGVQIRAGFDGSNLFDSNSGIHAESWQHIAVVSTATGDVETYIDGVLDSWHSGLSAETTPNAIVIGADGESKAACFKGIIDEVAVFNRALSGDEIWKIYQNVGRPRGYEQGLVGYWNFDNDQGDVVKDRSRYGNDGKLGGWPVPSESTNTKVHSSSTRI
ncbi:MAG: LamG domain-containing protein [Planctomycetota bacterium]|jgi:hypothetical protein